jgi:hypothetical protein
MNIHPHKFSREETSEPLHQLLLNFGKGLLQRPQRQQFEHVGDVSHEVRSIKEADSLSLQARVRELTIKQVAATLRLQNPESEEIVMLQSLESLVLAGEISFGDYMGRVQNLFPKVMESLDVPLRMKVASLML